MLATAFVALLVGLVLGALIATDACERNHQ